MKKETWVYREQELKDTITGTKKNKNPLRVAKASKYRWTPTEEHYLLEFLPKMGLKSVAKSLRRSPVAVRSKFLRLTKIVDNHGRMTVSLKKGEKNENSNIKSEHIEIARKIVNELSKSHTSKVRKAAVTTTSAKVEETNPIEAQSFKAETISVKEKNSSKELIILSMIMSSLSLLASIALVLKFIF